MPSSGRDYLACAHLVSGRMHLRVLRDGVFSAARADTPQCCMEGRVSVFGASSRFVMSRARHACACALHSNGAVAAEQSREEELFAARRWCITSSLASRTRTTLPSRPSLPRPLQKRACATVCTRALRRRSRATFATCVPWAPH